MFSFAGFFYLLDAAIAFGIADKLFKSFKEDNNNVTRNFAFMFFFLALAFFFWGIPSSILPEDNFLLNIGSLAGESFIFIGFAFGMRSFIASQFPQIPQNIVSLVTILFGILIVSLNATRFGSSFLNSNGIIEWNLHPTAILIYTILIFALAFPLSIKFFITSVISPEVRLRSLLLGLFALLGGAGGILVILNAAWQIIALGYMLLSLGFACAGWTFFFVKPSLKNHNIK